MRVIFLYTCQGAGGVGRKPPWDPKTESKNHFVGVHGLQTEGYFHMLLELKKLKAIDDLVVFIESARYPGSKVLSGVTCYVVPKIECVEDFLQENDVIFVRGGFRGWYNPFLLNMKKQRRWLLLYAANTGRQRWPIWDIVLSDLIDRHGHDARGRFWFFFKKPISPKIFYPIQVERDIDVCVGASKIHDKKAQWKAIDAVVKYKKRFGKNLKCIMPGAIRYRGTKTSQIVSKIREYGLNVEQPGFVTRHDLNKILNRSKLFIYLGNSGENDRGPLEATSVGCPTILGGVTRHAPFLRNCKVGILVSKNPNDPSTVADEMYSTIKSHTEKLREHVIFYFNKHNGFNSVIVPEMIRLFELIRRNPTPNLEALKKEYNA